MTTASDDLSADGELRSGRHLLAGVLTLLAGIVLLAGVLFGLTAGIGAIWTSVTSNGASVNGTAPGGAAAPGPAATSPAAPVVQQVRIKVNAPPLGGVKTPGGQVHDAFVPADIATKVGETVQVTVLNYDDAPHTWTSPDLGLNVRIPGGSESHPSRTTFTIRPTKAGTFEWYCATPCDPWSMTRNGYMRGRVTVA